MAQPRISGGPRTAYGRILYEANWKAYQARVDKAVAGALEDGGNAGAALGRGIIAAKTKTRTGDLLDTFHASRVRTRGKTAGSPKDQGFDEVIYSGATRTQWLRKRDGTWRWSTVPIGIMVDLGTYGKRRRKLKRPDLRMPVAWEIAEKGGGAKPVYFFNKSLALAFTVAQTALVKRMP